MKRDDSKARRHNGRWSYGAFVGLLGLGLAGMLGNPIEANGETNFRKTGLAEINPPEDPPSDRMTALVGGRVIDGRGGEPVSDAVVVIDGAKIAAVGSVDTTDVPSGADTIDVSGMSILPGLLDSHFHSTNDRAIPRRFLRNGVTTFRDPGHPFRFYQAVKLAEKPMPRVFLCGGHLDGFPPIWPQQARIIEEDAGRARKVVQQHVRRGASGIKIYFRLPLELYRPVCRTADKLGVPVTAHLELVDADAAIRAGVDGIEHVTSFGTALADDKTAAAFKKAVSEDPDARREERYRLWADLDLDSSPRVEPLLKLIREREVVVSPTLAVFEKQADDSDAKDYEVKGFRKMLRFVGLCHEEGIPVVVGSHTWVPYADTGWAYQRELELLVKAGLSPLEAIRAGTLKNARFFGASGRLGSLEAGKAADLIVVAGNPDEEISAMRNVRRVMLNGSWGEMEGVGP